VIARGTTGDYLQRDTRRQTLTEEIPDRMRKKTERGGKEEEGWLKEREKT
jgi:hypothetical protein